MSKKNTLSLGKKSEQKILNWINNEHPIIKYWLGFLKAKANQMCNA